jgi:cytochrome c oxidase subunit 1
MNEVISCFVKRRIFGYSFVALSTIAIATFGFIVWGHHMFVTSQSMYSSMVFSIISFLVAIPSAIKVFNWVTTMYKGSVDTSAPFLYACGFIGLFTVGGLTGLFLAALAMDIHLTMTYFVVAHFHYIMVGGALTGFLAGLHFWWPKISGRMYPEAPAKFAAIVLFIGFNLTFFPQFILGYLGMPRRYHFYAPEYQIWNVMSSAGASVLAVGLAMPVCYFLWSLKYGKIATANPWGAVGLEWMVPSPPPTHNFEAVPVVTWEAYEYSPFDIDRAEEAPAFAGDRKRPGQILGRGRTAFPSRRRCWSGCLRLAAGFPRGPFRVSMTQQSMDSHPPASSGAEEEPALLLLDLPLLSIPGAAISLQTIGVRDLFEIIIGAEDAPAGIEAARRAGMQVVNVLKFL